MTLCILADRIHNIPDWRQSSKPWAISQNHVPVANGCFPHVSQFYPRPLLFTPLRFLGFIVFLSTTWTRQQSPVSTAPTLIPALQPTHVAHMIEIHVNMIQTNINGLTHIWHMQPKSNNWTAPSSLREHIVSIFNKNPFQSWRYHHW